MSADLAVDLVSRRRRRAGGYRHVLAGQASAGRATVRGSAFTPLVAQRGLAVQLVPGCRRPSMRRSSSRAQRPPTAVSTAAVVPAGSAGAGSSSASLAGNRSAPFHCVGAQPRPDSASRQVLGDIGLGPAWVAAHPAVLASTRSVFSTQPDQPPVGATGGYRPLITSAGPTPFVQRGQIWPA